MRLLLVFASALLAILSSSGLASARPLGVVKNEGVLRVAVYDDFPPFSYRENGAAKGIDVAVAEQIAGMLGVKLDVTFITAGETLDSDLRLNFLRGDLAGSPLSDVMMHVPHDRTFAAQQDMFFFAAPYFQEELVIAYDKDVEPEIRELRDLAGKPIAVEVDSASDLLLLMADDGVYRGKLRHYRTFAEVMATFLRKEAPIIIGVRSEIEGGLHETKQPIASVRFATLPQTNLIHQSWPVGVAVKANATDLAREVDNVLAKLRQSGELERIFDRFGVSYKNASAF